ncbi:hypothetical protein ACFYXM_11510 [Streptomyces sp. NPDC002476]|uniref:hypothetical protein n=1 Tax=Streptomyces sp. NPDC002476 TaxID=3364648 RepID=UPI0036944740
MARAERFEAERRERQELAHRIGRTLAAEFNDRQVEGGGWHHQVAFVNFVSVLLHAPQRDELVAHA